MSETTIALVLQWAQLQREMCDPSTQQDALETLNRLLAIEERMADQHSRSISSVLFKLVIASRSLQPDTLESRLLASAIADLTHSGIGTPTAMPINDEDKTNASLALRAAIMAACEHGIKVSDLVRVLGYNNTDFMETDFMETLEELINEGDLIEVHFVLPTATLDGFLLPRESRLTVRGGVGELKLQRI